MLRSIAAAVMAVFLWQMPQAFADHAPFTAWDINQTVNETNFIVGSGCSGTLISLEHRLVVTNHHCIDQYYSYKTRKVRKGDDVVEKEVVEYRDVDLSQKRYSDFRNTGSIAWKGQLVAFEKRMDLALIQIREKDLPYTVQSQVYSGNGLHRADTVFVVGNPLGLDASITRGIISSMNRMFRVGWAENAEVSFIQVDAGIAPGNSGGALYDEQGHFIGIPAAGAPGTAIGLAIPYPMIQEFLTENCYESVWNMDEKVESYDACVARKEAEAEEDE